MAPWASLWILAACTAAPLDEVPWEGGVSTWYEVRMGEHRVGVEERATWQGQRWRRRWQHVRVNGRDVDLVRGEAWGPVDGRELTGGALLSSPAPFDLTAGEVTGSGEVRLPYGEVVQARVVRVQQGPSTELVAWWDGPSAQARFDDAGLVEARLGALTWRRVPERPGPWSPVDVHGALAVPVEPVARARRRRIARYRVGDEEVTVESPLDAELPRLALGPSAGGTQAVADFVAASVDAQDAVSAVRQLAAAVAVRLADDVQPSAGDGATALAEGRGDCTEHTALFLEGAQILGLRARPVAGLLYVDAGVAGPALYPHAWAEVQLGGRWVAADPTLGMFPADAARLPLHARIDVAMDRLASGVSVEVLEMR